MRQIKPSEIKPGMEIEIVTTRKMTVNRIFTWGDSNWDLRGDSGHVARVNADAKITVLAEPAPPKPEEPTTFGARVDVAGRDRFVRADEGFSDSHPWLTQDSGGTWASWAELCEMGAVTVIDADPSWTVPADGEPTPEVPDRIEEWPEDDEALRPYQWRDHDEYIWAWLAAASEWGCYDAVGDYTVSGRRPSCGPWTRVTDA